MGAVYAARHVHTNARVALKRVLVVDHDPEALARFDVEARALAQLRHPNVVHLLEAGRDGQGRPWIAMERVDGEGLDAVLRRDGPLPAERALELIRPLVSALAHAHERGVVHRDLKPSNVLLRARDDAPLLTDFGLAKRLDQSQALTQTGEVLGTPGYLAPEQCGVPGGIGPATDVYGLGALLYALLTGQPPCRGATLIDSLRRVIEVPPRPPSELAPVPAPLEALCLRCLEKSPARRFRDMASLGEALDALERSPDRRPPPALLASAALLTALGIGAIAGGASFEPEVARPAVASSAPAAPVSPVPLPSASAPTPTPSPSPSPSPSEHEGSERDLAQRDFSAAVRAARADSAPWEERLRVAKRLAALAWEGGGRAEIGQARQLAEGLLRDAPRERRGPVLLLLASFETRQPPKAQNRARVRRLAEGALEAGLSADEEGLARSMLGRVLPPGADAISNAVAWVRLAPQPQACLALGLELARANEPGAAVPFLRRALREEQGVVVRGNALVQLGIGAFLSGDFELALKSLGEVCALLDKGAQVCEHLRLLTQVASAVGREAEAMEQIELAARGWSDPLAKRSCELAEAQLAMTRAAPDRVLAADLLDLRPEAEELEELREWRADLELRRHLLDQRVPGSASTRLPTAQFVDALKAVSEGRVEDGVRRLLRYPHPLSDLRRFAAAVEAVQRDPRLRLLAGLKEFREDRAFLGRGAQIMLLYPEDARFRLQVVAGCTALLDRVQRRDSLQLHSQPLVELRARVGLALSRPLFAEEQDPGTTWRAKAQLAALLLNWARVLGREGWRPLLDDLPGGEAAATRALALTEGTLPAHLRLPQLEMRVRAFLFLGRTEEARPEAERAVEEFPASPRALLLRAELRRKLGQGEAEAATLRQILTLPDSPWHRAVEARLEELGR